MRKKISIFLCVLILGGAKLVLGQIPPNFPNNQAIIKFVNECGVGLCNFEFGGVQDFPIPGGYTEPFGVGVTQCGWWNTTLYNGIGWMYQEDINGGQYNGMDASTITVYPGHCVPQLCCVLCDPLPVGMSVSPSQQTLSWNASAPPNNPQFLFTVTNPFNPKFKIDNLDVDMNRTTQIYKCGAADIFSQNQTVDYGVTNEWYKLTIYNSDVNKNQLGLAVNQVWNPYFYNNISYQLSSYGYQPNGQYFIVEYSVRSSCSNGAGIKYRGHIRYNGNVSPSPSTYKFTPPTNGGTSLLNQSQNMATAPQIGAVTGAITGVVSAGSYIETYRMKIEEVGFASPYLTTKVLFDSVFTAVNGQLPDILYFANRRIDPDGIGVGSTATVGNYFYNNYNTIKNNCYKLTVWTTNKCNTSTPIWSYFKWKQGGNCPACRITGDTEADISWIESEGGRWHLYPNPTNENVYLEGFTESNEVIEIKILNASGQLLLAKHYQVEEGKMLESVSVKDFPQGLYFYQIRDKNGLSTHKFVKE